jgi:hypothetical protein
LEGQQRSGGSGTALPVRRRLELDDAATPLQAASRAGGAQGGAQGLSQPVLVKRIRYIFEVKQSEQLERLPRMLERNAGKEEVFYGKLMTKFNLDESFFPPQLTLSRLALVERIQYVYENKEAEHLDKLPRLLAKNAGREAVFYSNLLRKYSLDESFFPAGQLPLDQLSAEVLKLRIEMYAPAPRTLHCNLRPGGQRDCPCVVFGEGYRVQTPYASKRSS